MYLVDNYRPVYFKNMLLAYQYFSLESVHGETMLKMGWMVKKYNVSFLKTLNWSKCILMLSLYIWLSIYTNNETLRIIWKFDLSPRGVLGRIYALSIEVLSHILISDFWTAKNTCKHEWQLHEICTIFCSFPTCKLKALLVNFNNCVCFLWIRNCTGASFMKYLRLSLRIWDTE